MLAHVDFEDDNEQTNAGRQKGQNKLSTTTQTQVSMNTHTHIEMGTIHTEN